MTKPNRKLIPQIESTALDAMNHETPLNPAQYTDVYFVKSRLAAQAVGHNPTVLWQVFQKKDSVLAGVKPMLEQLDGAIYGNDDIEIWSLDDGDVIAPGETVMLVKAPFQSFVEFESIYLGTLAEATKIATNVRNAVKVANGKQVLFFPARFTPAANQYLHGYAAGVGGAAGCATQQQADGWSDFTTRPAVAVGTMPHALIAAFDGDTVGAALAFAEARRKYSGNGTFAANEPIWVLVDFHNNCAKTAVEVFKAFKERGLILAGIRLDTSEKLTDEGLGPDAVNVTDGMKGDNGGVHPTLVFHVRKELDAAGANDVKIAVSGGFTPDKIKWFEKYNTPADVYAIGEGFLAGSNPFTSDIVMRYEGTKMIPCAKLGREYKPNTRLKPVVGHFDTVTA